MEANITYIPKDLTKLCDSDLMDDELIYFCGQSNWIKFNKNYAFFIAAQNGWLDLLKWAKQNGCDWNSSTCSIAAHNGHLEVLKWARENGCKWNSLTCSNAAENGHLEVLKWARENGCDWNSYTCSYAARNGIA